MMMPVIMGFMASSRAESRSFKLVTHSVASPEPRAGRPEPRAPATGGYGQLDAITPLKLERTWSLSLIFENTKSSRDASDSVMSFCMMT
jgi:hypothetical protein